MLNNISTYVNMMKYMSMCDNNPHTNIVYDNLTFYNTMEFPITITIYTINNKLIEITVIPLKHITIKCNIYSVFLITYQFGGSIYVEPFWLLYVKNTMLNIPNKREYDRYSMITHVSRHPFTNQMIVKRKSQSNDQFLYTRIPTFSFMYKSSFIEIRTNNPNIIDFMKTHININTDLSPLSSILCSDVHCKNTRHRYVEWHD